MSVRRTVNMKLRPRVLGPLECRCIVTTVIQHQLKLYFISMADHSLLTAVNLVLDPRGPALICKTCQYALAVSKSQVTSHLWEKHKISLASRRDITSYIHSLNIPNPVNLPRRPDRSFVHPHLKVYGGYACLSCIYRTINLY
jgi:hypothetical protein